MEYRFDVALRRLLRGSLLISVLVTTQTFGSTLYLPLNDPIAPEVERLAVVSGLATMARPYPLSRIRAEAERVAKQYPTLSQSILGYLDRVYGEGTHLTHVSGEVSASDSGTSRPVANDYGQTTTHDLTLTASGVWNSGPIKGLAQIRAYEGNGKADMATDLGYLSLGPSWAQLDVGFRDHWFAPGRGDSPLISNNADSFPALTLSNPEPFSFLGLHYELFVGRLAGYHSIMLGTVSSPGHPYLAGTQITIRPVDWFEFGLSRTFQFGGGQRTVGFNDFVQAFFNPTGKDNVGLGSCTGTSPNCEFGNQEFALSGALKLDLDGFPMQVYTTLGAEDTGRGSALYPGNVLMVAGVYFPWLTPRSSLRAEYSDFQDGWYVHHIYIDGYVNDGRVLGGSWGDLQGANRGRPGSSLFLQYEYSVSAQRDLELTFRRVGSRTPTGWEYAHDISMVWRNWTDMNRRSSWNLNAELGEDNTGTGYWLLGAGYDW